MSTDTPKTDAVAFFTGCDGRERHPCGDYVTSDFARHLERENGVWRELSARMADEMRGLDHEFASLRDYDAALAGKEGQQ